MTIHGNPDLIQILRGTLQGDTISPFLFTIFMEPLLRWLAVGRRGYRPSYQPHKPTASIITYDDHGYADDISITAGSIKNLKIQLKKTPPIQPIHRLTTRNHQMRGHRSPMDHGQPSHEKKKMLQDQIHSITFPRWIPHPIPPPQQII